MGLDEYTAECATALLVKIYDRGGYLPVVVPSADGSLDLHYEHPRASVCVTVDAVGDVFYLSQSRAGELLNEIEHASSTRVADALAADLGAPDDDGPYDPLSDRARLTRALAEVDSLIEQRTSFINNRSGTMFDAAKKELVWLGDLREVLANPTS